MAERKKMVASIERSEKYLLDQEAKLDLLEETINQPLNEDVEGNINIGFWREWVQSSWEGFAATGNRYFLKIGNGT